MGLLRRCRVNAALTIQLFSQLFHFINMWLFNRLVTGPESGLCSHYWGAIIRQQLGRVEAWAEKQGLELAADCHLSRIVQVGGPQPRRRRQRTSCACLSGPAGPRRLPRGFSHVEAVRPWRTTRFRPGGFATAGVCGLRPGGQKSQSSVAAAPSGAMRASQASLHGSAALWPSSAFRGWLRGRPHLAFVLTRRPPRARVCPNVHFLYGQRSCQIC